MTAMIRLYRRPLALFALLTIFASGPAHATLAHANAAQPARRHASSCASGVSAPAVCDRALGVALTVPTGWSVTPPGHFPPGALAFWTVVLGRQNATLHLIVEPVGLAQHCGDAQAATAVADALTAGTNSSRPILRDQNTVAGAPAVFLTGLPGAGPSIQIIVAHNGAVYHLLFPGTALQPDQRLALASLLFIPRVGPFPGVVDPGLTPALRACATAQTGRLSLADALGTNPLTLYADGAGFPASRAVTVRLSWQGTPLPRQRPRYTSYTTYQTVRATSGGVLTVRLSVPVRATAFAVFTVRVVATDARTGTTLATVARTFRNSNGMLTPAPVVAQG
jgi:hypothetical protein